MPPKHKKAIRRPCSGCRKKQYLFGRQARSQGKRRK